MLESMRLAHELPGGIGEGDPLPPEDRVVPAATRRLETLFREHRPRLLRFLLRRTSNDTAEDLTQQAFARLAALDHAAVDAIESPGAYLHRTAVNLLKDEAKSAARHGAHLHVSMDDVAIMGPDQIAALEARDMLARLEAVMLRLKPRTREIFLAHRIDGYSYAEIAARTGLGIKAVEKHMSRAIAYIDDHSSFR
ncbi:RNA polymerase sigma factor [Sphingomonas gei]|uniref:RNA polymerase sigma factor n=1 Tax=Sphingomonas gei TaxID=1395960 RepID=A0A4S1XJ00_9SPHN|nr:RNA polymerase sigma factor [Sphingomonas gei]TGX55803.1 RNA polymerase sigma factor [Sphingomonas gei]